MKKDYGGPPFTLPFYAMATKAKNLDVKVLRGQEGKSFAFRITLRRVFT